ncbi:fungal-specific transcription factor domain-containing protein [Mycena floridula]|nr:fungal-specific transcription factor domain-containing protein [Mycena floridula]
MSPAVTDPYCSDQRPFKRSRKEAPEDNHFQPASPPLDHIFIAESLVAKKPGVKKAPLSCCECRRLKLKCDRTFPCASCKKRGVSDICPDGVLVSGKGTRFILSGTQILHEKLGEMSSRIRSLEEALEGFQSNHPLLQPELLNVKSTVGLYTGSQTDQPTAAPENHDNVDGCPRPMPVEPHNVESPAASQDLDKEVQRLSNSFPIDRISPEPNLSLRAHIRQMLPPQEEAEHLWRQTQDNALWQYNPHPDTLFFGNLMHHVYCAPVAELNLRRLGLMFMILAVGCIVDLDRNPDSPVPERYHALARASLCEVSVMADTTVETITALFYEIWYLLVFSDKKKAAGYAWGLMGLTAKLAQSIGLHRNGKLGKVIPEEVEKRRSLFWELMYLDARLSLSLGRPPSLSIEHMDCRRPSYEPIPNYPGSEGVQYYQEWKHSCLIEILAPLLDAISKPSLEYTACLALDKKIRDFHIPLEIKNGAPSRRSLMQKASLATALEAVLLQLHRNFFLQSVSSPEQAFNRSNPYAPSVVAVFLSASRMIATLQDLYMREPRMTSRLLGYWSNAFSASVALCLLVSRAPFTCLVPAALQELERARALFNRAKDHCPRAQQVTPVLETMVGKANDIYTRWSNGQNVPTIVLRHTDDYPDAQLQPLASSHGDPFSQCHKSLGQCIAEVHERAKVLLPLRRPCSCSDKNRNQPCPPSHSWAPPPPISQGSPVLPELYLSNLSRAVVASRGTSVPPLSPNSRFSVGNDTLNFEVGALNPGTDQSWMAWF